MKALLILILGFNGFWLFKLVALNKNQLVEYKSTVIQLSNIAQPDYVVVGSWDPGILFEHYVLHRSYTGRWISTEFLFGESGGLPPKEETIGQWRQAIFERKEIWILDYNPLVIADLRNAGYIIEPFKDIWRANPVLD